MPTLSYVDIFAENIEALSAFYRLVFGFTDIPTVRSPSFIGLDTGQSCIGFNAKDYYAALNITPEPPPAGVKFLLTIDVDSPAEVDRLVPVAVARGAKLMKPPFQTDCDWYQAVLLDPEENVLRINYMLPPVVKVLGSTYA